MKRAKKYGFFKVINELMLFFYVKKKVAVKDLGYLKREIIRPYWKSKGRKFSSIAWILIGLSILIVGASLYYLMVITETDLTKMF